MSDYHRLSRSGGNGNGLCQKSRNVKYFSVLVVLSLFLFIFYLYFSTSNELQSLRQEYENQNALFVKLKNEILDSNTKMEKLQTFEKTITVERDALKTQLSDCQASVSKHNLAAKQSETIQLDKEAAIKSLQEKLRTANEELEKQRQNCTSLLTAKATQSSLISQLNQTVSTLQSELTRTKTAQQQHGSDLNPAATSPSNTLVDQPPEDGEHIGEVKKDDVIVVPTTISNVQEAKKISTTKFSKDNAKEEDVEFKKNEGKINEAQVDQEIRNGHGEFLAKRKPGGRVQLEEENQKREKLEEEAQQRGDSPPLAKIAAKIAKKDEVAEKDANKAEEDNAAEVEKNEKDTAGAVDEQKEELGQNQNDDDAPE